MAELLLTNVSKSYGPVDVLRDINLHIETGELIVFVGPSGCGKSTLLRMIAGLERITGGVLEIDGEKTNDVPPAQRFSRIVGRDRIRLFYKERPSTLRNYKLRQKTEAPMIRVENGEGQVKVRIFQVSILPRQKGVLSPVSGRKNNARRGQGRLRAVHEDHLPVRSNFFNIRSQVHALVTDCLGNPAIGNGKTIQ